MYNVHVYKSLCNDKCVRCGMILHTGCIHLLIDVDVNVEYMHL